MADLDLRRGMSGGFSDDRNVADNSIHSLLVGAKRLARLVGGVARDPFDRVDDVGDSDSTVSRWHRNLMAGHNGAHLLPLVRAGVRFVDGIQAEGDNTNDVRKEKAA